MPVKQKQPNILLIMSDQQRYDSLGCYGADWIHTPNLDHLASGGVLFENCYVNNPVCTPSRASMFTGKHLPGHGVYRLHDVLPDDEVLFTSHLQDLGYTTALFGKLHVSGRRYEESERHPHDGFDIYEWCLEASISMNSPFNGYSRWLKEKDPEFHGRLKKLGRKLTHIPRKYHLTHWAAERTIDFIRDHSGEAPFFCMMSVFDPHNPYDDFPSEYTDRVNLERLPEPAVTETERHHIIRGLAQEQQDGYLGPFSAFTDTDFLSMREGYFASVALLDDEVGRVLEALEAKGIAEETLVIFLSDHGDMLGDHGLMVKGAFFYDPCVKVPLIVRQPGVVPEGRRTQALVQPHDIAATVLSAAGMKEERIAELMPDSLDIRSSLSTCHETAVCAYRQTGIDSTGRYFHPPIDATMITDGSYKLNVYHPEPGVDKSSVGQLFNLIENPEETHNLWGQNSEKQEELMESLMNWLFRQESIRPRRAESAVPSNDELFDNRVKQGQSSSEK